MVLILFLIDCLLGGMYDIGYLAIRIIPSSVRCLSHFCEKNRALFIFSMLNIYFIRQECNSDIGSSCKNNIYSGKDWWPTTFFDQGHFPYSPHSSNKCWKKIPVWLIRQHQRLEFYLQVYLWARVFYYTLVNQFEILVLYS